MENYNRKEKYKNSIFYYLNNKKHRLNGPAIIWDDGDKEYWQNDKLHRLDGPAIKFCTGYEEYWIEGKQYSKYEFERIIKLKLFW
jgi:hypothetical protein